MADVNKLSKNLLKMKFMKKAKEQSEKDEGNESNLFGQNYGYLTKQQRYLFEPSYAFFENSRFGRISYKGMNIEIERIMNETNTKLPVNNKVAKEEMDDVEITDQEMANRYIMNRKAGKQTSNKRKRED